MMIRPYFPSMLLLPCLLCIAALQQLPTATAAVKMEEDFGGYMEGMAEASADAAEMRERLERHRIWRETTWGGYTVRQIQALGDHFSPFFLALSDVMKKDDSAGSIIVISVIRLIIIFMMVGVVYFGGYLVQTIIGSEYLVEEEEVVVIEDVDDEGGENVDDDNDDTTGKRREKKKKN